MNEINETHETQDTDEIPTSLAVGTVMTRLPRRGGGRKSKYLAMLEQHRGKWVVLRSSTVKPPNQLGITPNIAWIKNNGVKIATRKIDGVSYVFGKLPR